MNKQDFLNIIRNPSGCDRHQLDSLEALVSNFPYCQSAHVLIAKAHSDQGTMLVDQKVQRAAAYTCDRSRLKDLLVSSTSNTLLEDRAELSTSSQKTDLADTDLDEKSPAPEKELKSTAKPKASDSKAKVSETGDEPENKEEKKDSPIAEKAPVLQKQESKAEKMEDMEQVSPQPDVKEKRDKAAEVSTTAPPPDPLKAEEISAPDDPDLDVDPKSEKPGGSTSNIDKKSGPTELAMEDPTSGNEVKTKGLITPANPPQKSEGDRLRDELQETLRSIREKKSTSGNTQIPKIIAERESPNPKRIRLSEVDIRINTLPKAPPPSPYRQSAEDVAATREHQQPTIYDSRHGEHYLEADMGEESEEAHSEADLLLMYLQGLHDREENRATSKQFRKKKQRELIDRFISEEPSITKCDLGQLNSEGQPQRASANTPTVQEYNFVSENLAGIYAQQGNLEKAIDTYERLRLKYPEKSTYFASLISSLENE